jgi:hypothetical protein
VGRCYEFAAVIVDGCEHAMRVDSGGGACVCPTCEAHCTGRFAGCASILEQPGFVPQGAPDWAVQCLPAPQPSDRPHGSGHRSAAAVPKDATADLEAIVRAELGSTSNELRELVSRAFADARSGDREQAALSASVEDALDHAQARLGDALIAQLQQALRPMMEQHRAQVLDAIEALRAELRERDEDRSRSTTTAEALARVTRRVGRVERSLGVTPGE